ncbi:hypothetical protein K474DRAFT_980541 [Panus rudis PR-1116 ss-1]|nr:hypothetical protein K474DRAFT_980541 [Panus rudis PR-1116 ss-1]
MPNCHRLDFGSLLREHLRPSSPSAANYAPPSPTSIRFPHCSARLVVLDCVLPNISVVIKTWKPIGVLQYREGYSCRSRYSPFASIPPTSLAAVLIPSTAHLPALLSHSCSEYYCSAGPSSSPVSCITHSELSAFINTPPPPRYPLLTVRCRPSVFSPSHPFDAFQVVALPPCSFLRSQSSRSHLLYAFLTPDERTSCFYS